MWSTYPLPASLPGQSIWGLAMDPAGLIWLETFSGQQAQLRGDKWQRVGAEASYTYADRNGYQWTIGVGRRLHQYLISSSGATRRTIAFSELLEDREGNVWLARDTQGLYRVRRQFITTYSKEQGLIDRNVYPTYQDRRGAIWIGAWPGGLSRFQDGKFTNFTVKGSSDDNLVTAILEDAHGRLWVASYGGVWVLERGRFGEAPSISIPDRRVVLAMHQDREGALWFGTAIGLLRYAKGASTLFTTKDGLAGDDVRTIVEDAGGDLWIGGYGGLSRLHQGRFSGWTERDGLPSNTVRAVHLEGEGIVWIGTYDGGLGRFQNGKFTSYTKAQGLPTNGVFQILEDDRDNFWMSSNIGIVRVSRIQLNEYAARKRSTVTAIAYGLSDGMMSVECNGGVSPAGVRARDGKLWFPTADGVAVVNPSAVPINRQAPPVVIEAFLVDRTPVPFDRPVTVPPGRTDLEIQYTALSFLDSAHILFRYRLEGVDSDWVDARPRRAATYLHVPPGRYTFTVSNRDGVWNTQGKRVAVICAGAVLPDLVV